MDHPNTRRATIYALLDPREELSLSNARYVGLTRQSIDKRLAQHISEAKAGGSLYRHRWIRVLLANGTAPVVFPLEADIPATEGGDREKFWIAALKGLGCRLTNVTAGRESTLPRRVRGSTACQEEGCGGTVHGRGWCKKHYSLWRAYGVPNAPSQEDRFWAKVDVGGPDECWEWQAATAHGYGVFQDMPAQRYAYELAGCTVPSGMQMSAQCGNTLCVNAAHLRVRTHREQRLAGVRPFGPERCLHGHPLTTDNVYVTSNGRTACRACARAAALESYHRRQDGETR